MVKVGDTVVFRKPYKNNAQSLEWHREQTKLKVLEVYDELYATSYGQKRIRVRDAYGNTMRVSNSEYKVLNNLIDGAEEF